MKIGIVMPLTGTSLRPRGPTSIDLRTRDIIQNVYIRKVEMVNGAPWAVEFETSPNVKDPLKEGATN